MNDESMSPGEFRSVIDYLGLTQDDAAGVLGVSPRTVRHWIAGRYLVPDGVRRALVCGTLDTDVAVRDLVTVLGCVSDRGVLVYRTDEAMWAARPDSRPWPARWWRHVVMRACAEMPGIRIEFAEDIEEGGQR